MKEKFSDFDGGNYLDQEGYFIFEIKSAELKDSAKGNPMWVFDVQSPEGSSTLYHVIDVKSRWSFNNLIAACMQFTPEERSEYMCDYQTIGQELVGMKFKGNVVLEPYSTTTKVPDPEKPGLYIDKVVVKDSYKIKSYSIA